MSKPELEFHLPAGPWTTSAETGPGVRERVLADDPDGGGRTVLVHWAPGTVSFRYAYAVSRPDATATPRGSYT
ncbi:hypothetical protein ACFV2X_46265 [Streptomyces sp. NPDC059679]|uniref:hypothetical protein n=1 Tax=Streptomyces sp. NPDC059679 TaxID=3346903 RepID=UPI0036A3780D